MGNATKKLCLVLILSAVCAAPAIAEPKQDRLGDGVLLGPKVMDAANFLPPPPAAGSQQTKDELAELHAISARSTPEMKAAAKRDSDDEKPDLFNSVAGFDLMALPVTARVLEQVHAEEEADVTPAKAYFHRDRPWIVDASIEPCEPKKPGPAANSYPSGHSTTGWSIGIVLAALMPEKSQAILARAAEFAENRLVCNVHYRSDIAAGQQFGTAIAVRLMENKKFRKGMDAARAELRAAHRID